MPFQVTIKRFVSDNEQTPTPVNAAKHAVESVTRLCECPVTVEPCNEHGYVIGPPITVLIVKAGDEIVGVVDERL
jgi:pyrimidine deaminase RibD-like protein